MKFKFNFLKIAIFTVLFICITGLIGLYSQNIYANHEVYGPAEEAAEIRAEISAEEAMEKNVGYIINRVSVDNIQAFIDKSLAAEAGSGLSEWYVTALKKYDDSLDFSVYAGKIVSYIENHEDLRTSDAERIALALSGLGLKSEWIAGVIDTVNEKKDVMSLIYALMLSGYGNFDTKTDSDELITRLFKYQTEDGGFSVTGDKNDVDVTAMALQAMAPFYEKYPDEIKKARDYLIYARLENGGYMSMGIENTESAAQALLAFAALNDTENADAVLGYIVNLQNADGGFPHLSSGVSNPIASCQAFMALIAYNRMKSGKPFIYDNRFYDGEEDTVSENDTEEDSYGHGNYGSEGHNSGEITGKQIKICIIAVLLILTAVIYIYLFLKKRITVKKAVLTGFVIAAAVTAVCVSNIETPYEHYNRETGGSSISFISINGPGGDVILRQSEIYINEGESVFEQLIKASIKYGIPVDYEGSGILGNVYIKGIDNLYEFDYGKMSGWTYTVNGEFVNVSASECRLNENDRVKWIYTENGGRE